MYTYRHCFKKKGFTLIELLAVVLIIGILVTVGAVAISTAIDKTNRTKVDADFSEYISCITFTVNANPQLARQIGYQNTAVLSAINANAEPELQIDLTHCGTESTLYNGGSTLSSISEIKEGTIVATKFLDPWGTPYRIYVQANDLNLTGVSAIDTNQQDAELRIFIISNGPNTMSGQSANLLDKDDIVTMLEYVNGVVNIGYHNTDASKTSKIYWFANDLSGFDSSKALNWESADAVLDMNYACLSPGGSDAKSLS